MSVINFVLHKRLAVSTNPVSSTTTSYVELLIPNGLATPHSLPPFKRQQGEGITLDDAFGSEPSSIDEDGPLTKRQKTLTQKDLQKAFFGETLDPLKNNSFDTLWDHFVKEVCKNIQPPRDVSRMYKTFINLHKRTQLLSTRLKSFCQAPKSKPDVLTAKNLMKVILYTMLNEISAFVSFLRDKPFIGAGVSANCTLLRASKMTGFDNNLLNGCFFYIGFNSDNSFEFLAGGIAEMLGVTSPHNSKRVINPIIENPEFRS